MTITHTQNIFEYMKDRYKKDRHIPEIEELVEQFPRAGWIQINEALYKFDAWHTEWIRAYDEGEGA